jgi:hypothetical protein
MYRLFSPLKPRPCISRALSYANCQLFQSKSLHDRVLACLLIQLSQMMQAIPDSCTEKR